MTADVRVISIGALAANPLWGERWGTPVRTGHLTTTLIRTEKRTILVDPALPAAVVAARLEERAGIKPEKVTHVFLTCFRPEARRGLGAFENAVWWISTAEREGVGVPLVRRLQEAHQHGDEEATAVFENEVAVLKRCEPAPDRLAEGVDLFPLPGLTPGLCGVLVSQRRSTLLVAGDAVATAEHLERGMVLPGALDVEMAQESFKEAVEIADVIVPGRDNITFNVLRGGGGR